MTSSSARDIADCCGRSRGRDRRLPTTSTQEALPFIGLPDPKASVLKLYGQEVNLFKLGRMPAQVLIDKAGIARYVHYGHSMSDIPENEELLALGKELNAVGIIGPLYCQGLSVELWAEYDRESAGEGGHGLPGA
ncbi:MAG: hypothetical protein V9G23_02875 [Giesbergeria sp.]